MDAVLVLRHCQFNLECSLSPPEMNVDFSHKIYLAVFPTHNNPTVSNVEF